MQSKENISEELRLISECVAAIPRGAQPPYVVPEGYFEGLAGSIMDSIANQDPEMVLPARHFTQQNPYAVPQGYFEGFAGKLLARIKAGQSGDPREELSVLSPLLDRIDKKTPFEAPEGYFSNLTGNVLSGVQAIGFVNDELENLSPLLTGLRDKAVYQVPEGYFESLSHLVLTQLKQQSAQPEPQSAPALSAAGKSAPVISMASGRSRTRNWLRYSAAAVTVGLILTIGWRLSFDHHPVQPAGGNELASNLSNNLSKVSDQEILNYLENQNIPLAETMANSSTATLDFSDTDVKNILGNVSDDELKEYLDDNGGTKDPVTN